MPKLAASLLLGLVVLAGCAGSERPEPGCTDPPCATGPTDPTDTTDPTRGPERGPRLPQFTFEDCRGVSAGINAPADTAIEHVPDEFQLSSSVPFTALFGVLAYECPRAVHDNQTFGPVALLWSYVSVQPRNTSWGSAGYHYYSYDVMVTNGTLADGLAELGTGAASAQYSIDATTLPQGVVQETWRFWDDSKSYSLTFRHDSAPASSQTGLDAHYWFGENPFTRVDVDHMDRYYAVLFADAGLLELSGQSKFHSALGTDASPFVGDGLSQLEWTIDSAPIVFAT